MTAGQNRYALITGASDGIGLDLAHILAADGWNLVVTARRGELLERLAAELQSAHHITVHAITADLSESGAPEAIVAELSEKDISLDALINNAGFGCYGRFASQDIERLDGMITVNITALLRLTRLILPGMIERRRGMIMNVASVAGFQPIPLSATYSATKAFVLSWSIALGEELRGSGITVTTLCPGTTHTGFQKAAGNDYLAKGRGRGMSSKAVAKLGYRGMLDGKGIVVTGLNNQILTVAGRFVPRSIAAKIAERLQRKNLGA